MFRRFYRKLPIFNFIISTTALTFQICVLNPWHDKLNSKFDKLQQQILAKNNI